MLYLVQFEVLEVPSIPREDFLDLIKREWEYFLRFQRKGKVLAGGSLAGRRGAVAIFDVEDNDEIEDIISNLPLFAYLNRIEVTPLIDIEKALADTKRMLRVTKSVKDRK
jgi:muconolactone D-isomerase